MDEIIVSPVLETRNAHERDALIQFFETGHSYQIMTDKNSKYTSVTTWVHKHFPKFNADEIISNMMKGKSWGPSHKYWGQTPEQIKASWNSCGSDSANAGTMLHLNIENFMNNASLPDGYVHSQLVDLCPMSCIEWDYFKQFVSDYPHLKPYRTEWRVFHEEHKLAGSIDMVYENPDGTLSIYDWKRSKEISKTNGWNKCATNPVILALFFTAKHL